MASFELCVSPVLTQNQHIWNIHDSLTLNNGKLIGYFTNSSYAIVSNMTLFFILFGMREKGLFLTLCFTCTDTKSTHSEFSWLTDFE